MTATIYKINKIDNYKSYFWRMTNAKIVFLESYFIYYIYITIVLEIILTSHWDERQGDILRFTIDFQVDERTAEIKEHFKSETRCPQGQISPI